MRDDLNTENQDSTQLKILKTAIEEFAEFGKAGARVDRIAEKAGVNKAMIYYHFTSKENLYYTSITEHIKQMASKLQSRASGDKSLEELVEGVVEEYLLIFYSSKFFKKILLRELVEEDSPVIKKIADIISQSGVPNILFNKLKSEMENGRIKKVDIKQTIASLISLNIGFFIIAPMSVRILNIIDFDTFLQERKKAVVDLFLHGVLV